MKRMSLMKVVQIRMENVDNPALMKKFTFKLITMYLSGNCDFSMEKEGRQFF